MHALRRIALPLTNSFIITALLFLIMHSLVYMKEPTLEARIKPMELAWVRIPEESPVETRFVKPEQPDEVQLQPDLPPTAVIREDQQIAKGTWAEMPMEPGKQTISLPYDHQLTLAIGFLPEYPQAALNRNIEGYVIVGFSVSEAGVVFDPYIIESSPGRTFNKSALKAILKFRYHARKVKGKAVPSDGQRYMFKYEIDA